MVLPPPTDVPIRKVKVEGNLTGRIGAFQEMERKTPRQLSPVLTKKGTPDRSSRSRKPQDSFMRRMTAFKQLENRGSRQLV